ncbi:hypothetical protein BC936DRAFT_143435 [Jimgerdemannia flammicorona]|uniref:Uncharacterized protein n=1 Tax=Jimgerdemannia flammicorona TaxID=994334 RepID=A0A432ZYZ4_9FUNG|nr:hypothetical protein BC936DRAFT_143435 [Jimgerdemannia flammicorona]
MFFSTQPHNFSPASTECGIHSSQPSATRIVTHPNLAVSPFRRLHERCDNEQVMASRFSILPQSFKIHLRARSPQIIPSLFWCHTLLRKLAPTRLGGHSQAVDIGYLLGDSLCG